MCAPRGEVPAAAPGTPHWYDLGNVAVVPLVETPRLLIRPEEFFPQLSGCRAGWCFAEPWYTAPADRLVYTIQSFLVVTPCEVVLVDGCVGGAKHRSRPEFDRLGGDWLSRFRATGIDPGEVGTVVLSHLHVDHVGWATHRAAGRWVPLFDRARHWVTGPELDYWTGPAGGEAMRRTGDYITDSVRPVIEAELLDLVPADSTIGRHIRLVPAAGHTPGNVCVRVSGSAGAVLLAGDTLHHPVQLLDPGLSTRYCVDAPQAADTRRTLLAELADTGTPMLPAHFAAPSAGRVTRHDSGYAFHPADDMLRLGQFRRP